MCLLAKILNKLCYVRFDNVYSNYGDHYTFQNVFRSMVSYWWCVYQVSVIIIEMGLQSLTVVFVLLATSLLRVLDF